MVSINLIPDTVRLARQRRYRVSRWAMAVCAAVAAVLVSGSVEWYRRAEAADLSVQRQELRLMLTEVQEDVQALSAEVDQVQRHVERAAALKSKRAWSGLFAQIGTCMPPSCWLASMVTDPAVPRGGPARSKVSDEAPAAEVVSVLIDAPRKLRLIGYAPDAAAPHEFVANLKRTDLFTDVRLEQSQQEAIRDGWRFRFQLLCEW